MIHRSLKSFLFAIKSSGPLICLDLGRKRIGIAISDCRRVFAFPKGEYCCQNIKKDIFYINSLINLHGAAGLIIGIPIQDDDWSRFILRLSYKISTKSRVNIFLQNEDFSTHEAISTLADMNYRKKKFFDNKVSSAIILKRSLNLLYDI